MQGRDTDSATQCRPPQGGVGLTQVGRCAARSEGGLEVGAAAKGVSCSFHGILAPRATAWTKLLDEPADLEVSAVLYLGSSVVQ